METSQCLIALLSSLVFVFFYADKAMLENVKKCKNFLSTLIKLAYSQPTETVKNVKALIQGLIVSGFVFVVGKYVAVTVSVLPLLVVSSIILDKM